jgi:hypothetical protein
MNLTGQQLQEYREKGWIVSPSLFAQTEVGILNSAVETINKKVTVFYLIAV